ncbi:unnamed protein product [Ectocarpus sp. 13 AM-2016]
MPCGGSGAEDRSNEARGLGELHHMLLHDSLIDDGWGKSEHIQE